MILLLQAEWMRMTRHRTNLVILALTLLLLGASAAWSGWAAAQYRADAAHKHARWMERVAQARQQLQVQVVGRAEESAAAARAAFDFAREAAPPALRPALGGLALSIRQFGVLPADVRVSVDSRHLDGRRSDALANPLLDSIGMPDFSVVAALLLPLAAIGLCYGLVQEAREQGVWRVVCAQVAAPWRVLVCGLLLRFILLLCAAGLASLPAFALDPGASLIAFGWWSLAVGAYCLVWVALAGVFNLLRLSAAGCALAMLATWLFVSFAAPAALYAYTQSREPAPSRLQAVIELREVQQEAELHMDELLDDWYASHPGHRPQTISTHTWPVSFIPRFLEQDAFIVPLMSEFEHARAQRLTALETLAWASPGLALVMVADRLAGADAAHHARYMDAVDRLEERWRERLVPRIMNYRGLRVADLGALPLLEASSGDDRSDITALVSGLLVLAALLMLIVVGWRRKLEQP